MLPLKFAIAGLLLLVAAEGSSGGCLRSEPCWPKPHEVSAFYEALDPSSTRLLFQAPPAEGVATPLVYGHPFPLEHLSAEENAQPLYGLGVTQMEPLYMDSNPDETCRQEGLYQSAFCKAIVQNSHLDTDPDFVVFPLTVTHIQHTLAFARRHNLHVAVVGAGHEFNGRNQNHRAGGSVLIRTILMKEMSADLVDLQQLGHASATYGAGVVMSEAQHFAMMNGKVVATGSCDTVGIVGWTLGGGHGPLASKLGLGADNLLAADIILASGEHVRASANGAYADLFKALRGGGGSTWGIVTRVVVRLHEPIAGGVTIYGSPVLTGSTTEDADMERLRDVTAQFAELTKQSTADEIVSLIVTVDASTDTFTLAPGAVVHGDATSAAAVDFSGKLAASMSDGEVQLQFAPALTLPHPFFYTEMVSSAVLQPTIDPLTHRPYSSAFVNRDQTHLVAGSVVNRTKACPDGEVCSIMLGQTLTGQIGSARVDGTSVSDAMRNAHLMILTYSWLDFEHLFKTFGNPYFNEVAPSFDDPEVYGPMFWGDNYSELKATKRKYDPVGVFSCRQCVA